MAMTFQKSKNAGEIASDPAETDEAFEALFQAHWGKICAVLYRMLGSWDAAQDLALDTFEQLYRHPPKQVLNLRGWLYRVATNKGLNALRAQKRRQHYEEQAGSQLFEDNQPKDPSQIFDQEQERQLTRTILKKMKARPAKLLVLRYSGLSYAEIAVALDIPRASVGKLLARAEADFAARYVREVKVEPIGATNQRGDDENAS